MQTQRAHRRSQPATLKQRELELSLGPVLGTCPRERESSKLVGTRSGHRAGVRTSKLHTGAITDADAERGKNSTET